MTNKPKRSLRHSELLDAKPSSVLVQSLSICRKSQVDALALGRGSCCRPLTGNLDFRSHLIRNPQLRPAICRHAVRIEPAGPLYDEGKRRIFAEGRVDD